MDCVRPHPLVEVRVGSISDAEFSPAVATVAKTVDGCRESVHVLGERGYGEDRWWVCRFPGSRRLRIRRMRASALVSLLNQPSVSPCQEVLV